MVKEKNIVYSGQTQFCVECEIEHPIEDFYFRKDSGKFRNECKKSTINRNQKYRKKNSEESSLRSHRYYEKNKEFLILYQKEYREGHKEEKKIWAQNYCEENKEKINEYKRDYENNRLKNDIDFKIKKEMGSKIRSALKHNNSSKNGISINAKLQYTIKDLIIYIEDQFEFWMTWENKGSLWHLDHIVPQSYLPYDSMDHPNFKKAWCLKNLRPLEAKRNILEKNRPKPDQDIEKMTQEEFEAYIEIYLDNYNKQKGKRIK